MNENDVYTTVNSGDIVIVEYKDCSSVEVMFINTGNLCVSNTTKILKGYVKDRLAKSVCGVGFIGVGKHKSRSGNRHSKAYHVWSDMLARCYSKRVQEKQPTYIGCTVADVWHDFQNFAEWYELKSKGMTGRFDLDKDITVRGNKVYSPDMCILISHKKNAQHSASLPFRVVSPAGVAFSGENLTEFCESKGLQQSCMCRVLNGKQRSHHGWTV